MTAYSVIVSPRAREQVLAISQWWRENRDKNPFLFEDELIDGLALIGKSPLVSAVYRVMSQRVVRRVRLSGSRYYIYFEVDDRAEKVNVLAVWHASRGNGPRLFR